MGGYDQIGGFFMHSNGAPKGAAGTLALGLIAAPRLDCDNTVVASLFFSEEATEACNLEEHASICTSMKEKVP